MSLAPHLAAARERIAALGAGRSQAEQTLIVCARAQLLAAERQAEKAEGHSPMLAAMYDEWAMRDLVSAHAYAHAVEVGRAYPAAEVAQLTQDRDMWRRRARELESLCSDRL